MITLLSWNIQCGRGVDGRVSLERIADTIGAMGGADIICLQEVARHDPACDDAGADQAERLAALFPEHAPFFGAALDRQATAGRRRQFGNMILSRLPVLQAFHHPLPQPPEPGLRHMPRQAAEVVVAAPWAPLRVITTHLEFHSPRQRYAQLAHLRGLHAQAAMLAAAPAAATDEGSPYAPLPRPTDLVLCGDFNLTDDDPAFAHVLAPFPTGAPRLADAWAILGDGLPHAPTCGVFDHAQWPQGPHARDFFLVAGQAAERVADLRVDGACAASDHQPLRLSLAP